MATASALKTAPPDFYKTARFNMVESQLRPNGILDQRIIEAMARLPREAFVAEGQQSLAYMDEDVSAGHGRRLMSPMVFAKLVQQANIESADRVLDVAPTTGYSCAVLNDLAGEVVALESDPSIIRQLQKNKEQFLLEHVGVVQGNLADGHAPSSPYQVIMIEGAVQWLPDSLLAQLAEGGRLLCVIMPVKSLPEQMGKARLYTKAHGKLEVRDLFDASAPLLPAFTEKPRFEF